MIPVQTPTAKTTSEATNANARLDSQAWTTPVITSTNATSTHVTQKQAASTHSGALSVSATMDTKATDSIAKTSTNAPPGVTTATPMPPVQTTPAVSVANVTLAMTETVPAAQTSTNAQVSVTTTATAMLHVQTPMAVSPVSATLAMTATVPAANQVRQLRRHQRRLLLQLRRQRL